jgi:hypothetical protein
MADDKRDEGDTLAITAEGAPKPISRRLLVFKTMAGALTLAGTTSVTTEQSSAQYYLRRGLNNDPYDPRNGRPRPAIVLAQGSPLGGPSNPIIRRDNDPYDTPGRGRGNPPRRRATDNDPYDTPGRGRGNPPRRRATDNDPSDATSRGRGRGW